MKFKTKITEMLNCEYPIIGAPMFLVSNESMVAEISNAGGVGTFPALNYRPTDKYQKAIRDIRELTDKSIGINIIVNKSNTRQTDDLKIALDEGVPLLITSLGNPKNVIKDAHKNGAKVFCDVTNLEHAKKVQDYGADAVVAVASGAGGHAGPITPLVLIPWLASELSIPVIAAGGIANGQSMLAALSLGAEAVYSGTRFIASTEAQVNKDYKKAIVKSSPEDIIISERISGTPATYINTPDMQKFSKQLPWIVKELKSNKHAKKIVVPLIHLLGMKTLEKSAFNKKGTQIWSAGQSVGLVNEIKSCKEIIEEIILEYTAAKEHLNGVNNEA